MTATARPAARAKKTLASRGPSTHDDPDPKTVNLALEAALKAHAAIFVICSTDETYPELVAPFAGLIKASLPKSFVIVAGYPKEHIEAFKAAGVDDFIHIRANCFQVLSGIASKLGIL